MYTYTYVCTYSIMYILSAFSISLSGFSLLPGRRCALRRPRSAPPHHLFRRWSPSKRRGFPSQKRTSPLLSSPLRKATDEEQTEPVPLPSSPPQGVVCLRRAWPPLPGGEGRPSVGSATTPVKRRYSVPQQPLGWECPTRRALTQHFPSSRRLRGFDPSGSARPSVALAVVTQPRATFVPRTN